MKFVFYTNTISPHQLPMAEMLVEILGKEDYRYVYTNELSNDRRQLGWSECDKEWILSANKDGNFTNRALNDAEFVMSGLRDFNLFERRTKPGLTTVYISERWLKPKLGILRLLHPSYFRMVLRFVRLLKQSKNFYYFPIGIHAARDMARLCGLFSWDIRCLFFAPKLEFDNCPAGRLGLKNVCGNYNLSSRYCLDKMRMWGYFVEPSKGKPVLSNNSELRVLWVGRLLKLKRVDTIVQAVSEYAKLKRDEVSLQNITVDIYGTGPEESRLRKMAKGFETVVHFYPPVAIAEVRKLMREHDVYVLSSNGYEGWGAVLSEALEEGMKVIGTYEAGSSATILPKTNLYHAGDWKRLLCMLQASIPKVDIGAWSARSGASNLCKEFPRIGNSVVATSFSK